MSSNPVQEGNNASFTVTRNGDVGATTVYISTSSGSATYLSGDFTKITAQPVTFANGQTTKTFSVSTATDSNNSEGSEYFWFDVYKNKEYAEADNWLKSSGWNRAYITDASGSPIIEVDGSSVPSSYTYTITNINTVLGNAGKVIEGEDAVFNVTRSGSGSDLLFMLVLLFVMMKLDVLTFQILIHWIILLLILEKMIWSKR